MKIFMKKNHYESWAQFNLSGIEAFVNSHVKKGGKAEVITGIDVPTTYKLYNADLRCFNLDEKLVGTNWNIYFKTNYSAGYAYLYTDEDEGEDVEDIKIAIYKRYGQFKADSRFKNVKLIRYNF